MIESLINTGFVVVFYILGYMTGRIVSKDDAVAHGYAEYYLDENNVRQWRWKK